MDINPKYVDSVREAILAIDEYSRNKNHVMAAAEIMAGVLRDKVMDGIFVISSIDAAGEVIKKNASDMAAALMTEISWNTIGVKDIWYHNGDEAEIVVSHANN